MNRIILFLLMICLPLAALLRGQPLTERLDSILATPRDSTQLSNLTVFLQELINAGEIVPDTFFEQALALGRELMQTPMLAIIQADRSGYYLNIGDLEKGLVHIEEAINYAEQCNEPYVLAGSYATKIQLLVTRGDFKESSELASALAKKYHEAGDFYSEAEVYQQLSVISSTLGNHELTEVYDSTAVALARKSGYVDILAAALRSYSDNITLMGYPEKGLELAKEAFQIVEEYELEHEVGNILSARAVANTELGNYTEALKDYELLEEMEGDQQFTWWMIGRGALLQRIGRDEEARDLLLEAARLIRKGSNNYLELKKCYQALQTVGLNQAQYDTVAWYGRLMAAAQDSIQTGINVKNLLELEKKYRTEEKEAEIRFQQEQLAAQQNKLYATITGLLLALVVGVVFFFLSRRLKKQNGENEQLLRDKETLIGEIHHRVKNNLQVVSSLLQLQRCGLETNDEAGRGALLESQNRVNAMGLIHNKLYQGKEVTSVYMPEYLEDLGETLLDAYRLEEQVEIFYDVMDIRLDVDVAIPLGLIINELVTNALKYAFPRGREGVIEIALQHENDQLRLLVTDNGVGAAAAEKRADGTSFGNNLIGLLTKKLKGSIRNTKGTGYGVEIMFEK